MSDTPRTDAYINWFEILIENACKGAMDESCDGVEKHCSCVPLLRSKVKELTNERDEARACMREAIECLLAGHGWGKHLERWRKAAGLPT